MCGGRHPQGWAQSEWPSPGCPVLFSQACPGSHFCPSPFVAHLVTDMILFFYVLTCFSMRVWTRQALEPDGPGSNPVSSLTGHVISVELPNLSGPPFSHL